MEEIISGQSDLYYEDMFLLVLHLHEEAKRAKKFKIKYAYKMKIIKQYREEGLSIHQIAKKVNLSHRTIKKWFSQDCRESRPE